MKKIAIIGSTGSIGTQVLKVVDAYPNDFKVYSLTAQSSDKVLLEQINKYKPTVATLENGSLTVDGTAFYSGKEAYLNAITDEVDLVVVAVVGFAGLKAVLKAIELKKDIALANKECLVAGGGLVMEYARKNGVRILPIDSEHSAIWQALNCSLDTPFNRLIITASGGAFRDLTIDELKFVKAKDALKHPNWNMGAKITVDCATLVNKAFEVIEARWLYNANYSDINAVIHRESIIHSMVEFKDNSILAQMSYPTMEIPIQLALFYGKRAKSSVKPLDLLALSSLTFSQIDNKKFPCFDLVVSAGKTGGLYPTVANGANEVAVKAFLEDKIGYTDIYALIDGALNAYTNQTEYSLGGVLEADRFAREYALGKIKNI